MVVSRSERSLLTEWWFTIDRSVLMLAGLLLVVGIVMLLSASPPVAIRRDLPHFYFVERQLIFVMLGAVVMIITSLLTPKLVRRLALGLVLASLVALVLVLLIGPEINGASRWLRFAGFSVQPSEILKPAFIIITAWAFAEGRQRRDVPAYWLAIILFVVCSFLLILQPDFGQTLLLTVTWAGMFFMAGLAWFWVLVFIIAGLGLILVAYNFLPHVASRINHFLDPSGENYQIARALEAFRQAGWFGRGPGEGSLAEQYLPDAHNDFIFAAIADEFGVMACLLLLLLYGGIVFLSLLRVRGLESAFIRYAVSGLMLLFALQTMINMSVNLGLIPAKGMTLPLISYGGTSMIGSCLLLGMTLALTKRLPMAEPQRV